MGTSFATHGELQPTRQCRNIRNIALDRLAKRFEQNKQISRYVFGKIRATYCPFFLL